MLFNSFQFIFVFLPLVLLGYYLIRNKRAQLFFLFSASVFFYAYWSHTHVFLLLFTVVLDFYLAHWIYRTTSNAKRKSLVVVSVVANLSVLGFFKYYNFFTDSLNGAFNHFGLGAALPHLDIVLPIGISFYTFQSMSYVIDVYRRSAHSHGSLLEFSSYVTLFPHQISGPLVRHDYIVPQLEASKTYVFNFENFWKGICFFVFGLAKKMLIADRVAEAVDPIIANIGIASNLEAVFAMIGYTVQLYFDFSGYSDMAVGLGLMMNIQFPANFNSPYKSRSITEFWKRWHITLSSWLRDYLYISLGGNRRGSLFTYRNLLLTMAIGGLWHGANWTFVVWGVMHGAALAIERWFKDKGFDFVKNSAVKWVLTLLFISVAWVFFRANSVQDAALWLSKVFWWQGGFDSDITLMPVKYRDKFYSLCLIGWISAMWAKNTWEMKFKPSFFTVCTVALLFVICLMYMGEQSPFLYFQF
ncbi:MBOAT family protein [Bdellovibrio bacteriovorus]|uniref:MBOAT family O-acyltransferase n=1 Tax=Bdellovibrio bacteriovorus TaxID=959 RepID=UPI0035A64CCC